jgi:hypothetical protein
VVDEPKAAPTSEIGYVEGPAGWWTALLAEAVPELQWPASTEVFDRMRKNAQVASVLRAITLPVRRTRWWIEPAGAREEVAAHVAEDFGLPIAGAAPAPRPRTKDRFSWNEHLRLALLELTFGHSIFEQQYRLDQQGLARLRKLAWRPPRTIAKFNVAPDGGLVSVEQHRRDAQQQDPPVIPVTQLVAYVNEREGGNWAGQSLLRSCYGDWLLKDRLRRVGANTIDRNGMGQPIYEAAGTGSVAENEREIAEGKKMATEARAGVTSGVATPKGAKLVFRGVEGDVPDALPFIRYCDEQIARAVLAHFLNLGTQTGSWALGSTFADFFTLSLQAVAEHIADVTTQHVIEDLVDLNYGRTEPAPRLGFEEIGSRQQATALAIKMLTDAGILLPDRALEEAARQQFGLPPKAIPPTDQGAAA